MRTNDVKVDDKTALLIIDVQKGFEHPQWGERNNLDAEANVAKLLATWRNCSLPVIHVQHDSTSVSGMFRPGTSGHAPKEEAMPHPGEPVYHKVVNSGFIGTTLDHDLRRRGVTGVVVAGLTTNHCVSTTTRMAGNLGYRTAIVSDATATFARAHVASGGMRSAEEVHLAALSDLNEEFATVVTTNEVIESAMSFCKRDHKANPLER
jgi:nicotinamidase-related amidase